MTDTPDDQTTAYRTFNIPGYGRMRAPANITEVELMAELNKPDADPDDGPVPL